MNSTQREAVARMFAQATGIDNGAAKESVDLFMPRFIKEYDSNVRDFKLDNTKASILFNEMSEEFNLPLNDQYVKSVISDSATYNGEYRKHQQMISAEKRQNNTTLGDALKRVLSVYTNNDKIDQLSTMYRSKNWQFDPSSALMRDPNNKTLQKQKKEYVNYFNGVVRANRLLKYLNNSRINSRVDINSKNPSELVAYLPEYGNMAVTLMSDDPYRIGNVNTWNTQLQFNQQAAHKSGLKNLPPEAIVDTLLNPSSNIKNIDNFGNGKTHFTNITRSDIDVPIFGVAMKTNRSATLDDLMKSNNRDIEDGEIDDSDFSDSTGLEDEKDTELKITPQDKRAELISRGVEDFKEVDFDKEKKEHGLAATIFTQSERLGLQNVKVYKNSKNVYKYQYTTTDKNNKVKHGEGIIGGYITPEKDGSNKLVVNNKLRGYSVPGMRGYIDTDTGQLKVKRFSQIMRERVRETIANQVMNPTTRESSKAYGALDTLYTTDSYSTIIDKNINSPEYENTLVKTLLCRVRLDNEIVSAGNAYNEDPDHVKMNVKNLEKLSLKKSNYRRDMMATRDIRTIPTEWQSVVDREMTGIGKTMGSSLFLGEGVKINPDGSLLAPDPQAKAKSPLHNLPLFKFNKFDPADRNIMAFNQAIRNVPIDKVNVAMMTMSGYTENDAAVITAKYAENHKIIGKDGKPRALKRGDKISDLHGNKSTISEIIDPNEKDPERREKLKREIAIVKANPDLDVIVNPYSSISRLNTGSVHEMQSGPTKQLNNPPEFPGIDLSHVTMGQENYVISVGQRVDEKTQIYDDKSFQDGKARRFSHQLAAGAASADLPKLLSYVYGNTTEKGWPKFFDDIHVLGYDVDKQHRVGYFDYDKDDAVALETPSKEEAKEISKLPEYKRRELRNSMFKEAFAQALDKSNNGEKPIIMKLPKSYTNMAGNETNKVVVPVAQIKADRDLAIKMGLDEKDTKKSSLMMNNIKNMYNYAAGLDLGATVKTDENGKKVVNHGHYVYENKYAPEKATEIAEKMSREVVARDFGSHHNIVKNEIYSSPMKDSATTVITPDPNLDIDEIAVGPDVYKNLKLKDPNESVLFWRDPILRDGGFRFMHVKEDKTLTGAALNPVAVKSMDADFDGDTTGIVPIHDAEVQKELEKQRVSRNLINKAAKDPESYLETGLELQGSLYRQGKNDAQKQLNDPNVTADTVRKIVKEGFNNDKAYGIGLDMRSKESYLNSIEELIKSGAKGHCERDDHGQPITDKDGHIVSKALKQAEHYYNGERTDQDMHESMIGLAVKVDGVGPAGAVQQKLLWAGRDIDPKDLMDFTYLATQSTLQAKHDGQEAKKRIHAVLGPIPKLMKGYRPNTNYFAMRMQKPLKTNVWEDEVDNLYNDDLGLNLSKDTIHGVSGMLATKDGRIKSENERMTLADPIDVLAYKHGYYSRVNNVLDWAMDNDKPIANGYYTKHFEMPKELCSDRVIGQNYENTHEEKSQDTVDIHHDELNHDKSDSDRPDFN